MESGPSNEFQVQAGEHSHTDDGQIEMVTEEEVFEDEIIVEGGELIDADLEGEYDCTARNNFEANDLYEMYQPEEVGDMFMCKICRQCIGKEVVFNDRPAYNAHRYKVHGSFNNSIICPMLTCKDSFASTIHLRRHLMVNHNVPLEMHHQVFANMTEFEKWRRLVEVASRCRFIMHTKQPNRKRQILHCSKSEHKQVLQSRTRRLPRRRMDKEGSCCPAVISYRMDDRSGVIHSFYELYHVGHNIGEDPVMDANDTNSQPLALHFMEPPTYIGDRPMQYLQIDFLELESGIYQSLVYNYVMVITDMHTMFTWAKPMTYPLQKVTVQRIVCDLLCQYGVPDGYSCCNGSFKVLVKETMTSMEDTFQVQIKEVYNESVDYEGFRNALLEHAAEELKTHTRWPETVPFITMNVNQAGKNSAFERFFKRKPHTIHPPPYLNQEGGEDEEEWEDYNPPSPETHYVPKNKVYLRNVDRPRNGNFQPFFYGLIGDMDYTHCPEFPYKVFYSRHPGPNESSSYIWASPYDILPMNDEMSDPSAEQDSFASDLLCTCKAGTSEASCTLFRNAVCQNEMSRSCCSKSGFPCGYHDNSTGDDSYTRMEKLTKYFSSNCPSEEKRQLRAALRIKQDKNGRDRVQVRNIPHQEGDFLVEVAGEEVVADGGGDFFRPESPDDPPAKKRRYRVKAGAGSIIVTNPENQAETDVLFRPDTESIVADQLLEPEPKPQVSPLEKQAENRPEEADQLEEIQELEEQLEEEPTRNQLEEYTISPSATSPSSSNQEPIRRSGRAPKTKVFQDFVTE